MNLKDKIKQISSKIKNNNIKDVQILDDTKTQSTYRFFWGDDMPKQPTNREILLMLASDMKEVKQDIVELKVRLTNVEDRLTRVENRLTNVENDMLEVKKDIKVLKDQAIQHGWDLN